MKVYSLLFFTTCFVLMSQLSFSQGCSDAGVCSVGSLNIIQFKYEYLPAEKQHLEQMKAEDTELMGDTEDLPASRQGTANYTPPQLKEKKTD
ncbi:hypothetical protein JYU20_04765, partial [Bacteroidales bacterium AH-315-I05]|nr:hypothetical protein [Bacteroidales bacterium AH-315-I05]